MNQVDIYQKLKANFLIIYVCKISNDLSKYN